jgi:hypothetical protein
MLNSYALVEEVSKDAEDGFKHTIACLKTASHSPYRVQENRYYTSRNLDVKQFQHPRELFDEFHALVLMMTGEVPEEGTRVYRCIQKVVVVAVVVVVVVVVVLVVVTYSMGPGHVWNTNMSKLLIA